MDLDPFSGAVVGVNFLPVRGLGEMYNERTGMIEILSFC
jgi:hypothetical protein